MEKHGCESLLKPLRDGALPSSPPVAAEFDGLCGELTVPDLVPELGVDRGEVFPPGVLNGVITVGFHGRWVTRDGGHLPTTGFTIVRVGEGGLELPGRPNAGEDLRVARAVGEHDDLAHDAVDQAKRNVVDLRAGERIVEVETVLGDRLVLVLFNRHVKLDHVRFEHDLIETAEQKEGTLRVKGEATHRRPPTIITGGTR